ncbi:MAG: tetratricopeptide repeat protein, partial [Gemmatimonadota bacterium]
MKSRFVIAASALLGVWCSDRNPTPASAHSNSASPAAVAAERIYDPEAIQRLRSGVLAERLGDSATARLAYQRAIPELDPVADWLRLRVASLTPDSEERAKMLRAVENQPASAQVGLVEARAREGYGDIAGAILAREKLGQAADVIRLRLSMAGPPESRLVILKDIVRYATDSSTSPAASPVAANALPFREMLGGNDNLALARASSVSSAPDQVLSFYLRARERGAALTASDHVRLGGALSARARYREASLEYARVTKGPLVPRALLERGRALIRADRNGKAVLEDLLRRFPGDTMATPVALGLLGDLARDAGNYAIARRQWLSLGHRFPASESAPRARFLAALVAWTDNRFTEAAREWDSLVASTHAAEEVDAAEYWAGRAWLAAGDSSRARERWNAVRTRYPLSYYAGLSSRRLGLGLTADIAPGVDSFPRVSDVYAAHDRLSILSQAGLTGELLLETRWIASQAGDQISRVLATAELLRRFHRGSATTQLGWRVLSRGDSASRTYRLIFPLLFGAALNTAAEHGGVEPALVAALI